MQVVEYFLEIAFLVVHHMEEKPETNRLERLEPKKKATALWPCQKEYFEALFQIFELKPIHSLNKLLQ